MSELKRYTINATSLDPTAAMFGPRSDDHPAKEDPDGLWCAAKDALVIITRLRTSRDEALADLAEARELIGVENCDLVDCNVLLQEMIAEADALLDEVDHLKNCGDMDYPEAIDAIAEVISKRQRREDDHG